MPRYTTTSAHLEIIPNPYSLALVPVWGLATVQKEAVRWTDRPHGIDIGYYLEYPIQLPDTKQNNMQHTSWPNTPMNHTKKLD